MDGMKSKIAAIDDLIEVCEDAIARPGKEKRQAKKAKPKEEPADKKAHALLDDMDADDLMSLYEKLEK
jgi:hypothetical protein